MQLPTQPLQTAFCCCTAGGSRARIGIATFDSQVQFYALRAGQSAPQMLVVPDVSEPYAPSAASVIVNAQQSRALVQSEDNHARQQWLLALVTRVSHFGQPNPRCELFAERFQAVGPLCSSVQQRCNCVSTNIFYRDAAARDRPLKSAEFRGSSSRSCTGHLGNVYSASAVPLNLLVSHAAACCMQAEQLLEAIPRLFEGSQASEVATGAAISAAIAALEVSQKQPLHYRKHVEQQLHMHACVQQLSCIKSLTVWLA